MLAIMVGTVPMGAHIPLAGGQGFGLRRARGEEHENIFEGRIFQQARLFGMPQGQAVQTGLRAGAHFRFVDRDREGGNGQEKTREIQAEQ